jgi:hypothetical protein
VRKEVEPVHAGVSTYDVFVSYRHQDPDRAWVRGTLVPALDASGLRAFVDHRDFRLGYPIVTEMARAVEQSRCTVPVLTPAYLMGRFGVLESVLAEHLGQELGERRLIYLMREPCEPPLLMRYRLWLEATADALASAAIARLVAELSAPEAG